MSELREERSGSVQLYGESPTLRELERLCERARELGAAGSTRVMFKASGGDYSFPSVIEISVPVAFRGGAA